MPNPLLYKIPDTLCADVKVGSIVSVPLRTSKRNAIVTQLYETKPADATFTIKQALAVQPFPADPHYAQFLQTVATHYRTQSHTLYQRLQTFLSAKLIDNQDALEQSIPDDHSFGEVILTDEQKSVVEFVSEKMSERTFAPTLMHGVTGSGKTEVYKRIIEQCIRENKSVVLLLPEVSLSLQFERILATQLSNAVQLFSFHSATKSKDRKLLWHYLLNEKPCLIIGVHLPIFLPISNLGCILVDEEHETGFQEKKHPKVNSKQAALIRAQQTNIPILLGSATPSLTSLAQVDKKQWHFFSITKRFSGTMPTIKKVLLDGKQKRSSFWITRELEREMKQTLERGEQVIIYLNRRGYSFFVQCRPCGYLFECPNCSVSLTLHKTSSPIGVLRCHYCDHSRTLPGVCPGCKGDEKNFLKKGIGTQQLTTHIQKIFPTARIARADLDSTKKKREWFNTVEQFKAGELDILVGTQLITKGYHFPNVTLVGIIWADLNLHFPVYDANETTLQKLIQVAGRAGRSSKKSKVVVQAMHDHPIFNYLNELDYIKFCEKEKEFRKVTGYPPYKRFAHLELKHRHETVVDAEAERLFAELNSLAPRCDPSMRILGPTQPGVHRIAKTESRIIFIKSDSFAAIAALLDRVDLKQFKSKVGFTPEG